MRFIIYFLVLMGWCSNATSQDMSVRSRDIAEVIPNISMCLAVLDIKIISHVFQEPQQSPNMISLTKNSHTLYKHMLNELPSSSLQLQTIQIYVLIRDHITDAVLALADGHREMMVDDVNSLVQECMWNVSYQTGDLL